MNSKAAQQVQVPLHRMARPGIFMRPGGRVSEGESPKGRAWRDGDERAGGPRKPDECQAL